MSVTFWPFSACCAPVAPWSAPTITFRSGCACSIVCDAFNAFAGLKNVSPSATTWMPWPAVAASKPLRIAASSDETFTEKRYPTLHGFALSAAHALTTRPPCLRPIWVCTKTTLPDSPATGDAAVPGFEPRIWSMLTTFSPALIACLIVGMSCGPKIGCTITASYCFEETTVCSSDSCFFVSFAASSTVTFAPCSFATAFAAASIGAS
jgi:hypothetical protein